MVRALLPRRYVRIPVIVSRLASGDELLGWQDASLRIRVVASRGRDDDAVESLLADVLGVARDRVRVVIGRGSRRKWVEIDDVDETELDSKLPGRESAAAESAGTSR